MNFYLVIAETGSTNPIPDTAGPPQLIWIACMLAFFSWIGALISGFFKKAFEKAGEKMGDATVARILTSNGAEALSGGDSSRSDAISLPADLQPEFHGLKAFDEEDSQYFHLLLPGQRRNDALKLPESIYFWLDWIATANADAVFKIGLLRGPSGCGKTSLMQAGILPSLPHSSHSIYIRATANGTERELLAELIRRWPSLSKRRSAASALAKLKEDSLADSRLTIVIDQLEQYLQSATPTDDDRLVQALNQCDGRLVKGILMVRDGFEMPVARLFRLLQIPQKDQENCALFDFFDLNHAKMILALFGRSFRRIALNGSLTTQENDFLNQVVHQLAESQEPHLVRPVRISMFVQVMKAKPWTAEALRDIGGAAGIGKTFLIDSFESRRAPPEIRNYAVAAKRVLELLLPRQSDEQPRLETVSTNRSESELFHQSGYVGSQADFAELLNHLQNDLRLITTTVVHEMAAEATSSSASDVQFVREVRYQLTHDDIVPSIRQWTRELDAETWSGRAQIRLADATDLWLLTRKKVLPGPMDTLSIAIFTSKSNRASNQNEMIQKAYIRQALWITPLLLLAMLAPIYSRYKDGQSLQQQVAVAEIKGIPALAKAIQNEAHFPHWELDRKLAELSSPATSSKSSENTAFKIRLALLPSDQGHLDSVIDHIVDSGSSDEILAAREIISYKPDIARLAIAQLWQHIDKNQEDTFEQTARQLRAAAMLAQLDPSSTRWKALSHSIAKSLADIDALFLYPWITIFSPVKQELRNSLLTTFRDTDDKFKRRSIVNLILNWAGDDASTLAELALASDAESYMLVASNLRQLSAKLLPILNAVVTSDVRDIPDSEGTTDNASVTRKSNAAALLVALGDPRTVWPLLRHSNDPTLRSHIVHRLAEFRADPITIVDRLGEERDPGCGRALCLILGELGETRIGENNLDRVVASLKKVFGESSDPGLRGASTWALRQLGQTSWVADENRKLQSEEQRKLKLKQVRSWLADGTSVPLSNWLISHQGNEFVVIKAGAELRRISTERNRNTRANPDGRNIVFQHSFAVSMRPVSIADFRDFRPSYKDATFGVSDDRPVVKITWFDAAEYCNWLSRKEGLETCYEEGDDGRVARLKTSWRDNEGYRLPYAAEWEYVARAGALTNRYFGSGDNLLAKYAWFKDNTDGIASPLGLLKPNDFGCTDMLGNVWVFCNDRRKNGDESAVAVEFPGAVVGDKSDWAIDANFEFLVEGGSFANGPDQLKSSSNYWVATRTNAGNFGFRLARTLRK